MLKHLIRHQGKGILEVVAEAAMTRGTPLEGGEYFADKEMEYNGINAVIEPVEKDNDTIVEGAMYLKEPTMLGERYATTELTATGLTVGDMVVVDGGKFVKPTKTGAAFWKYQGVYENPFGVDMYIVERVPSATVTVG